jgi:hypothetical protein
MLWDESRLRSTTADPELPEAIAENYRQLVLHYEKRRDFEAAEDFHIGEMEICRLSFAAKFPRWVRRCSEWLNGFALYRVLSAYGTSYWQALLVLVCMIFLFSTVFLFSGLSSVQPPVLADRSFIKYDLRAKQGDTQATLSDVAGDYARTIAHTLSLLTFQRERQYRASGPLSQAFEAMASIFLAGQSALLLLAIRRKFRR